MKWVRVIIHDVSQVHFPDICPNCLQSPAETLTPVVRSVGGPLVGSLTTHVHWPMCHRCSLWTTRSSRWCRNYAIYPAGLLALLALLIAIFRTPNGPDIPIVPLQILLGAFLLAISGCFIATVIHWWAPHPERCISNFPTIKPIRGGTAMISGKSFVVLEFLNPLYVEALVAENSPQNVVCKEKKLASAKKSFLKRYSK